MIYLNRSVISSFNTSEYYWFYSIYQIDVALVRKKKTTSLKIFFLKYSSPKK